MQVAKAFDMRMSTEPISASKLHVFGSMLFFLSANIIVSPLSHFIDSTAWQPFRGPVIEELLKYFLFFFCQRKKINISVFQIALAVGLAETLNNMVIGYIKNEENIAAMIDSIGIEISIVTLMLAIIIKFTATIFGHYISLKAGLLFLKFGVMASILTSILVHLTINLIVVAGWN